jgi:hypothetical protein
LAGPGTCGKPVDGTVPFETCGGTDGRGIGIGVDIGSAIGGTATGGGGGGGGVDTKEAEGVVSAENIGDKLLLAAINLMIIVYHLMISYNQ